MKGSIILVSVKFEIMNTAQYFLLWPCEYTKQNVVTAIKIFPNIGTCLDTVENFFFTFEIITYSNLTSYFTNLPIQQLASEERREIFETVKSTTILGFMKLDEAV